MTSFLLARRCRRLSTLVVAWALASLYAVPARACGTCAAGDPTLTLFGVAPPTRGRVRAAATFRHREEEIGVLRLRERRLEAALAWAPHARVMLSVSAPVVQQRIDYPDLAVQRRWGFGDADLRGRFTLLRDRAFAPRHVLGAVVGLELPTASRRPGRDGGLDYDLLPGSGTWDPLAGLAFTSVTGPFSLQCVSTLTIAASEREGVRAGPSWRSSLRAQIQPWTAFAFRVGGDSRVEGPDRFQGTPEPDGGGAVVFVTAGVAALLGSWVSLQLELAVPLLDSRRGREEGVAWMLGLLVDA